MNKLLEFIQVSKFNLTPENRKLRHAELHEFISISFSTYITPQFLLVINFR